MAAIWAESFTSGFRDALDLMQAAVRDCTDELWQSSMWRVPAPDDLAEVRGPDGNLVADPSVRHALVQRHSTPWGVAWHALERLDHLLTGGFAPWAVWPPLSRLLADGAVAAQPAAPGVVGHTGLDLLTMSRPWSRAEVLAYIDYCRARVIEALEDLTDVKAATAVGRKPYAARLLQAHGHVIEHASQIRQFITAADMG